MNSSHRDRRHHHMSTVPTSTRRGRQGSSGCTGTAGGPDPSGRPGRTRREGETTIIKADSDAELLGLVPSLMGYHPKDSFVVIPFVGKRCGTGMRLNLPKYPGTKVIDALSALCVSNLSRMQHCTAVMLVVFTDEPFVKALRRHRMPLKRVELALLRQGFGIRRTFVHAADGWAEIDDEEAPVGGYDPAELESALPDDAPRPEPGDPTRPERQARLPERDPARAKLLAEELDLLATGRERTGLGVLLPLQEVDHGRLVEQLLERTPQHLAPVTMARFCICALQPALRDPMLVQLAFGEAAGDSARRYNLRHHERMRQTGLSSDDLAMRDLEDGREVHRDVSMIMGDWPDPPDADRLQAAQDVMAHIAAHAPAWARPPVLCVLGWLCWASGGGSAAGAHLQEALRLDPGLRMAGLLLALVDTGKLPEWGFRYVDRMVSRLGDGAAVDEGTVQPGEQDGAGRSGAGRPDVADPGGQRDAA